MAASSAATEARLIDETEKWLCRAEAEFKKITACEANEIVSASGLNAEKFIENIAAYLSDCRHFGAKKDYVRAFEAVIWAWAWIEIGIDAGIIKKAHQCNR